MRRDAYIRLKGGMLEKLFDRALESGAVFAMLRRINARTCIAVCDIRSADILIALCRKYKIDAKILHFHGAYALWERIKARWTIFPAALIAACAMFFFFGRIWRIDVVFSGPNAHSGDQQSLIAQLHENGVYRGVPAKNIQTGMLEKQLLAEAGDYSFIGIRTQGVRMLVEASPELPSPDIYDISSARDLVASMDGIIENIEVHSGTACVHVGDTVRKGQILILGEEQKSKEETTAVSALGKVYARCWYEGSAETPRRITRTEYTGNIRYTRTLRLLGRRIALSKCENFTSEACDTQVLPLIGLFIPIEIETGVHRETIERIVPIDDSTAWKQLEVLARADALSHIDFPENHFSIRSSWLEKDISDHTIGVRAVYEISTAIAVSRDELAKEDY